MCISNSICIKTNIQRKGSLWLVPPYIEKIGKESERRHWNLLSRERDSILPGVGWGQG